MAMEPDPQNTTDGDLVAASRAGDRDAYAILIHRHARRVYAVCLGMLGDVADSEDIAQETFMRGLTHIHALRVDERFSAWISQIARNLCRDYLKSTGRRRELLEQRALDRRSSPAEFSDLYAALDRLPEKHRLPLVLYYLDGRSVSSVAEELGVSEAAAYNRLSRSRRALRSILLDTGGRGVNTNDPEEPESE
jgi:RNA polymerase sigma-70 factor (ECF subfamily)